MPSEEITKPVITKPQVEEICILINEVVEKAAEYGLDIEGDAIILVQKIGHQCEVAPDTH